MPYLACAVARRPPKALQADAGDVDAVQRGESSREGRVCGAAAVRGGVRHGRVHEDPPLPGQGSS